MNKKVLCSLFTVAAFSACGIQGQNDLNSQDDLSSDLAAATSKGMCYEVASFSGGNRLGGCVRPNVNAGTETRTQTVVTEDGTREIEVANVNGRAIADGDMDMGAWEGLHTEGAGRTALSSRWPGKIVYYTIDPALPNQTRVTSAISHWQANTAIRFVKRTTQSYWVTFRSGGGCSSNVGRIGGQQFINLASGCSTGNTIHEIGHTVGLWHEQTRTDRDNIITIWWANILAGTENNFKRYVDLGNDGKDYGAFDFGSIMLYDSYAFSKNGQPTITRKNGTTFTTQRVALSAGDKSAVAQMYP